MPVCGQGATRVLVWQGDVQVTHSKWEEVQVTHEGREGEAMLPAGLGLSV